MANPTHAAALASTVPHAMAASLTFARKMRDTMKTMEKKRFFIVKWQSSSRNKLLKTAFRYLVSTFAC